MSERTGEEPPTPVDVGLNKVTRPRLYEQLVKEILNYVRTKALVPGDLLPPERELAEQLGVSRATLSQALVALEVQGVIRVQHGTGAVLVFRPTLADAITGLREHSSRLPEIVEARLTLEVKLAELAALRRTAEDLEKIESALGFMAAEIENGDRGVDGDEKFHAAITQAAHSKVLGQLMKVIAEMILETRIESLAQEGRPETSLASHRTIFDAIKAQDGPGAAAAMSAHIELVSDVPILRDSP